MAQAHGTLYRDEEPLDQVRKSRNDLMKAFYNWLKNNFPGGAVLVGHGAFSNGARLLVDNFCDAGYSDEQIERIIIGFSDTLVAFPKFYPSNSTMNNFCLMCKYLSILSFAVCSFQNRVV